MKNSSIRIYALAVCFVSVICAAITSGFALYNLLTLASPQTTIEPSRIEMFRSNETLLRSPYAGSFSPPLPALGIRGIPPDGGQNRFAEMSEPEITDYRLSLLEAEIEAHRSRAIQSLIRQAIIIFITSILFFVHWKLANSIGTPDTSQDD